MALSMREIALTSKCANKFNARLHVHLRLSISITFFMPLDKFYLRFPDYREMRRTYTAVSTKVVQKKRKSVRDNAER